MWQENRNGESHLITFIEIAMTDTSNAKKVVITPEALEQLEQMMEPEELQVFLDELKESVESGTIFEQSTEVDLEELKTEDPETYQALMDQLEKYSATDKPNVTH
ncbi:MAG: hypothetical protein ACXW2E_01380 [Nitrososphaeraceae archaeon]